MRNDEWDDLDRVLDEGLASYTRAEPRPGLEQRVLRRVLTNDRRKWWMAAWLIPAVAVLALLLVPARKAPAPGWGGLQSARDFSPARVGASKPSVVREVPRKRKKPAPPTPRRRQFPTPSPLSEEERALLTFAARHPEQVTELAADLRKTADPIQIGELHIEPLQNGN